MRITSLLLRNFRNYQSLTLCPDEEINIFLGENAQGKTNIIEAIWYGVLGRSHRTRNDGELIRFQEEAAGTNIRFLRLGVEQEIDFRFRRGLRRQIVMNGNPIRPRELIGALNAVIFSPDDLSLIKGAPEGRRRFLDMEISQANPRYYSELLRFNRILRQRATLLKRIREAKAPVGMLSPWDEQLVDSAARLVEVRRSVVAKLSAIAGEMQSRLSGGREQLLVSYEVHRDDAPGCAEDYASWYGQKLRESQELDIIRGVTRLGPQRDDLRLEVGGVDLRTFGSQGQQRTGILALKLAELEFLHAETGEYPILLLDDVMSELDMSRRRALLEFMAKEHIQTFITATEAAYFPVETAGRRYRIVGGSVMEQ